MPTTCGNLCEATNPPGHQINHEHRTFNVEHRTEEDDRKARSRVFFLPSNLAVTGGGQDARTRWRGHPARRLFFIPATALTKLTVLGILPGVF